MLANFSAIFFKAGCPFITGCLEATSASTTFTPKPSKISETDDFPDPIPPVKPTTIIKIIFLDNDYIP
mgnify:FL=1